MEQSTRPRTEEERYKRKKFEIPASAREVKARFPTEPDRALVLEIKRFCEQTATPHLHPDVTHNAPPSDTIPRFLEKFDILEKFGRNEDRWCPCPICSPERPQFKKDGMITWWPDEGVIRVIGGDCFQTLNPQGYEQAQRQYKADVKQRTDETYLLRTLWRIPLLRSDISLDLRVARAIDTVRSNILAALDEHQIALWPNIKAGVLQIDEKYTITPWRGESRARVRRKEYARIRGKILLDPSTAPFADRLKAVELALAQIDFGGNYQERVLQLSDRDRRQVATLLRQTMKGLEKIRGQIEEARRFLSAETAATIRTWSGRHDATCSFLFDFDFEEHFVRVGLSRSRSTVIKITADFFEPLTTIATAAEDEPN